MFGTKHFRQKVGAFSGEVAGIGIPLGETVKNLGITFDNYLTFTQVRQDGAALVKFLNSGYDRIMCFMGRIRCRIISIL